MFEMLVFGLGIFELKLATLEPELAILLGIFEPEHVILESELAILETRACNLTEQKFTISFCFFVYGTLLVLWSVSEYLNLVSWSSTWLLSPLQTMMTNSCV